MNSIRIENPWLLFVALPLIIAVVVGFLLIPKQKRFRPKNVISLILHIVISISMSLAFANIQFLSTSTNTELYVVADCSNSEEQNVDKINTLIHDVYTQVREKNPNTKIGVIGFGKNQEVLVKPGENYTNLKTLLQNHKDLDGSATDIASALQFADSQFSEDVVRKMILISDGIETDNSAISVIDELVSDNVALDTIGVTNNVTDEVAITALDYTDHCFVGRNEDVKVTVKSKKETSAKLTLTSNGTVLNADKQDVELTQGVNVFTISLQSDTVGTFDYQVTISGVSDTYKENNTMSFTQDYTDIFDVLVIGDSQDDEKAIDDLKMYPEHTNVTFYAMGDKIPDKIEDFIKYDEIVLSNVSIPQLDDPETFVTNLNTAVSVYGKSLLTFGATYSGAINEDNSYLNNLNDMLPVQYESDEGKALVLVIDVSGSMDTDNRLTMAKKGAIAVLDSLDDKDYVSIISFSDQTYINQSLTSVKNKAQIIAAINKMKTVGGTEMNDALVQAGKQLAKSDLEYKNIITLSDGEPFDSDATLKKTVLKLADQNITCSFINISNNDSSSISLLQSLANVGNGTYYYCKSAAQLQDVMLNSVAGELANSVILPNTDAGQDGFDISYKVSTDPVLTGTNNSLPTINGAYYCRIKNAATTVLTITYYKAVDDEESISSGFASANIPLYAYWDYGEGKVASFASSITDDDWTSALRKSNYGKIFFQNAGTQTLPERNSDNILSMKYTNNGTSSSVTISPNNGDKTGRIVLTVKSPDKNVADTTVELLYDGTGYSGLIPTGVDGKYTLSVSYYQSSTDKDGNVTVSEDVTVKDEMPLYFDYSKEYDLFSPTDNSLLYELAKKANGQMTTDVVSYQNSDKELSYSSYKSTMMFFLLFSVILFLVDVFVRKSEIVFKKKKEDAIPVPQNQEKK